MLEVVVYSAFLPSLAMMREQKPCKAYSSTPEVG
jgi:hypothetical protein